MSNKFNKVKEIVANVFKISVEDISTGSRKRRYVNARCVYAQILFDKNMLRNYSEIGRLIDREHSTVINLINNHENFMVVDVFYRERYKEALKLVTEQILGCESFNLMKLFKRIDIKQKCKPCV